MTRMTFPTTGHQVQGADPFTAAMLSLVPGLGQIYNGEKRKGVLFLEVAAINYFLLWLVISTSPLLDGLKSFGSALNVKPNTALISALRQAHLGSPLSLIIIGLVGMFLAYAVRDAYDRAAQIRRRKIYPEHVIEFTEATSGSYLFHFAAMATCFILALFFLVPKPPAAQVTEITFIRNVETNRPAKTDVASTVNSTDAGRHRMNRPVGTASGAQRASNQQSAHASAARASVQASESQESAHPLPRPVAPQRTQLTPRQPSAPAQPAAAGPHLPTPTRNASQPQPAVPQPQPLAPAIRTAQVMPLPVPTRSTPVAPPQPVPVPSRTGQAAAQPVPALPRLAFNAPSLAPALPVAGRQPSGSFAPQPLPVNAVPHSGTGSFPTPVATHNSGANQGVPGAIAPIKADTGAASSGPSVISPVGVGQRNGQKSSSNSTAESGSAPTPVRADGGPHGSSHGPALAVAPVGGPAHDAGSPDSGRTSDGSPRANANPNAREQAGSHRVPDWGPYMMELQRRIKQNWFPPKGFESKRVVVLFKIHRDGALSHLVLDKSSGASDADQAALKAVENAAPFRHLPDGADEDADIQFTFDYNVFGGRGSIRQF